MTTKHTPNFFTKTISNQGFTPYTIFTKSGNIATPPKNYYGRVRKDDIGELAEAATAETIHVDLINSCSLPCNEGLDHTWIAATTSQLVRMGYLSKAGEKEIQNKLGIDIIILPRAWTVRQEDGTITRRLCLKDIEDGNVRTVQVKYQPHCPSFGTANIETHKFVGGNRIDTGINTSIADWHCWAINGDCSIMLKTEELKDLALAVYRPERMTSVADKKADAKKSTFTRLVPLIDMLNAESAFTITFKPAFREYFSKAHDTKEGATTDNVSWQYYTQPWDEAALRLFLSGGLEAIELFNSDKKLKRDQIKVLGNTDKGWS